MDNFCSNPDILSAINIIKQIYDIIIVIVPVILVVTITISLSKAIINNDSKLNEVIGNSVKKLLLAVSIFVLPSIIISLITNILNTGFDKKILCLNEANDANIFALKVARENEEKIEEKYVQ